MGNDKFGTSLSFPLSHPPVLHLSLVNYTLHVRNGNLQRYVLVIHHHKLSVIGPKKYM